MAGSNCSSAEDTPARTKDGFQYDTANRGQIFYPSLPGQQISQMMHHRGGLDAENAYESMKDGPQSSASGEVGALHYQRQDRPPGVLMNGETYSLYDSSMLGQKKVGITTTYSGSYAPGKPPSCGYVTTGASFAGL